MVLTGKVLAIIAGATVAAGGATTIVVVTNSGPTRSVASYCDYIKTDGRAMAVQLQSNMNGGGLDSISGAINAIPQVGDFLGELAQRAPVQIEEPLNIMANDYKAFGGQESGAAGGISDPGAAGLNLLGGGMFDALSAAQPSQQVQAFTQRYCGRSMTSLLGG